MTRTLIISDVHGRYQELLRVLDYCQYEADDRLVFVGDNIDRGPDSKKVMELLILLSKSQQNVFLQGNHEEMVMLLADGNTARLPMWLEEGQGRLCMRSYGVNPDYLEKKGAVYSYVVRDKDQGMDALDISFPEELKKFMRLVFPEEHLQFMRSMKTHAEIGDYHISHAGPASHRPLKEQQPNGYIWGDSALLQDNYTDYRRILIFGHWHAPRPFIGFKKIGIALDGRVAALELETLAITDSNGTVYSVNRKHLFKGRLGRLFLAPIKGKQSEGRRK